MSIWDLDPDRWATTACGIAHRNLTRAEWKQYLPGRPYERTCAAVARRPVRAHEKARGARQFVAPARG